MVFLFCWLAAPVDIRVNAIGIGIIVINAALYYTCRPDQIFFRRLHRRSIAASATP